MYLQVEHLPHKGSQNFYNKTGLFCRITTVYSESYTQPQNTLFSKEVITVLERVKRDMYAPAVHKFVCT
jgi:hypothetical protein